MFEDPFSFLIRWLARDNHGDKQPDSVLGLLLLGNGVVAR